MNEETVNKLSAGPYEWAIIPDDEAQMDWVRHHFSFGSGPIHMIWLPSHDKSVVGSDPQKPDHAVILCMTGNGPNSEANCKALLCLLVQRDLAKKTKSEMRLPIPTTPDTVAWAEYAIYLENALGIADAPAAESARLDAGKGKKDA